MKQYIPPSIYIRAIRQSLPIVTSITIDDTVVAPEDAEAKQSIILNFWGEELDDCDDLL